MHDGNKRRKIMPSRKRHLYPKRKISRKIRGGNNIRQLAKFGSSLVFSVHGVPAILAAAGVASPGTITYLLSHLILGGMFQQIYGFLQDEVLSDENITKVAKIIHSILPASIFSYLFLSLYADFSVRDLVALPYRLKESLISWSNSFAATATTAAGTTAAATTAATNVPAPIGPFPMILPSDNPDLARAMVPYVHRPLPMSLPSDNTALMIQKTGVPAPIGTFPMSLPSDNPDLLINQVKKLPEVMQCKFGEFVGLLKELLLSSSSATGLTTTGNVITAAAIGFAIYYIKTRLTANREENEKLNKQLSEHERRRLLIYRYQQRMKQYEETEKETDELEQKEEEEIKSEKHFRDLVSEKREMKEEKASEKRRMKEEEEEQIVLKKPKTPTKRPRTPKKRPPTPAKNYRPEFGDNTADQYKLRPSTPK
jgi:hypothetical protein